MVNSALLTGWIPSGCFTVDLFPFLLSVTEQSSELNHSVKVENLLKCDCWTSYVCPCYLFQMTRRGNRQRWHLGARVRAISSLKEWSGGGGVSPCQVCVCSISSHQLMSGMCVARAHVSHTGCAHFIFNPAGVGRSGLCLGRRLGARSPVPSEQEPAGPVGL